jgi:S-formylglutathione hydrolase FrmB
MKVRNIFTVFVLCCFLCLMKSSIIYTQSITQGTVQNISFFSPSLGEERYLQVYLPNGYDPNDTTRYPVLYFLHGAGGNQTSYPFLIQVLDTLISDGTIKPVIVVKPDGRDSLFGSSFYTNSILYGNFEDYIVYDLVSFIDSSFHTHTDRLHRSIMGHSMGAYGAMKLALKHPDIFSAVASHSGGLDFTHYTDAVDSILAEYQGGSPYQYNPNAGDFSYFAFSMAGAFSPNLLNPPYFVDFPLDSLGNPIYSTINKWLQHSPTRFANYVSPDSVPSIYFDCGMEDNYTLFGWNTGFKDTLVELGLQYIFAPYHGNHWNHLINRFRVSLTFLDSVRNIPVEVVDADVNIPTVFNLEQNYPNPFNPSTTIIYSIPEKSNVTLKIYDILGSEVETLVNEEKPSGTYELNWNAARLPSGVYFYQLDAGDNVSTRKLILMK